MQEAMNIDYSNREENDNENDTSYVHDFEIQNSSIDLDNLINGYTGYMRIARLLFLAEHCPPLKCDAYKAALGFIQETFNTNLYSLVFKQLNEAINKQNAFTGSNTPQASFDGSWLDSTNKKAALKLEKLDLDLKASKSSSIKDSIRRGQEDLAEHFMEMGDFSNALKCYTRSRDYCSSTKNIINMCFNVIKVSVYLKNWQYVLTYVAKAEFALESNADQKEDVKTFCKLKCATGLAELNTKRYKVAAKHFLQATFDNCDFSDILTPNHVAIYAGLCALATYDRQDLQRHVIQSSTFKSFLEVEPQVRDLIHKFYESKYAICLKLMDQMRDCLMLDLYLSPHVNTLYSLIRNRALRQYVSPYKSADLNKMALAFNTSTHALEDELTTLILDGHIQGRIDSQNKVLYAKDIDQRSVTFEKSLEMGKEFQKRTKAVILRSLLMKYNIMVKPQYSSGDHPQSQQQHMERLLNR